MSETTPAPFVLADIAVSVFRAPIDRPVRTAFGVMTDRPAVIVRAVERDAKDRDRKPSGDGVAPPRTPW